MQSIGVELRVDGWTTTIERIEIKRRRTALNEFVHGHDPDAAVNSVAFGTGTNGQPLLASADSKGTVRVWDPDTGDPITAPLTGHGRWVWSVAFGTGTR